MKGGTATNLHEDLKRRHEVNLVGQFFVPFLRREGFDDLRNPRAGSSGDPDVLCDTPSGAVVGVEVADGYMSARDATALWSMVRRIERAGGVSPVVTSTSNSPPELSDLVVNPDERLVKALQRTLEEHCLRRFGVRTYLLLNASHAPLTSAEDATFVVARLRAPSHRFDRIYLCLVRNWSSERMFYEIH